MVTCAHPNPDDRRGRSGFRQVTIALFCCPLAAFGAPYQLQALLRDVHFLRERNAHVD
jgi:hypothetical protein